MPDTKKPESLETTLETIRTQNDRILQAFELNLQNKGYARKTINNHVRVVGDFLECVIMGTDMVEGPLEFAHAFKYVGWNLERLYYKYEESADRVKQEGRGIKALCKWMLEQGAISQKGYKKIETQIKNVTAGLEDDRYKLLDDYFEGDEDEYYSEETEPNIISFKDAKQRKRK